MAWTSAAKTVDITKTTEHKPVQPGAIGRALGIRAITFGPAELFGAAARCSHLHHINPSAVTPESEMVKALLEHHIDDSSPDFFTLPSADQFKDFVANHFFGTMAAGLSYLTLIQDGYAWVDHFENLGGGNPGVRKSPDFVFGHPQHQGVALLESKGTRRANSRQFNIRVEDGYLDQVEPHLGHIVGNSTATHGYCIGSWLTSPRKAEIYVHSTEAVSTRGSAVGTPSLAQVQQGNYATALQLAHGPDLASQVRTGRVQAEPIPFLQFEWLGRQWLTSSIVRTIEGEIHGIHIGGTSTSAGPFDWRNFDIATPPTSFAVDRQRALAVLNELRITDAASIRFQVSPMPRAIVTAAREEYWSAVFPDGLAVVSFKSRITNARHVRLDKMGNLDEGAVI